jgi:hypothetical protein
MAGLLFLLVLPLAGVVTGGTLLAARSRRARFCPSATTFSCLVRFTEGRRTPERGRWPRRRWRAAWAHDVLLLQHGRLLPRVTALPVRMPEEALRNAWRGEFTRLGNDPVVVLLRLDDDRLVEVAAEHAHRHDLVGPFLAAAIPGLPRGPREQRNLGR